MRSPTLLTLSLSVVLLAACSSSSGGSGAGGADSGPAAETGSSSGGSGSDGSVDSGSSGGGEAGGQDAANDTSAMETGGPSCSRSTCPAPSCCDANGMCQPGTANNACVNSDPSSFMCQDCPGVFGSGYICVTNGSGQSACQSPSCAAGQPACNGCCENSTGTGVCYPGNTDTECGYPIGGIPSLCDNCTTNSPPGHCNMVTTNEWLCQ